MARPIPWALPVTSAALPVKFSDRSCDPFLIVAAVCMFQESAQRRRSGTYDHSDPGKDWDLRRLEGAQRSTGFSECVDESVDLVAGVGRRDLDPNAGLTFRYNRVGEADDEESALVHHAGHFDGFAFRRRARSGRSDGCYRGS